MSNGRRIRRHRRVNPFDAYARRLAATGMPDREVARAVLYVEHFGFEALSGPGCAVFAEPSCSNWNCLNPDHQVLESSSS